MSGSILISKEVCIIYAFPEPPAIYVRVGPKHLTSIEETFEEASTLGVYFSHVYPKACHSLEKPSHNELLDIGSFSGGEQALLKLGPFLVHC